LIAGGCCLEVELEDLRAPRSSLCASLVKPDKAVCLRLAVISFKSLSDILVAIIWQRGEAESM
jgi:hypothetical protein